jgi:hypothetical protein
MRGRNYRGIWTLHPGKCWLCSRGSARLQVGRKALLSFEFECNLSLWSIEVYDIPSALGLSETNGS